MELGFTTAAYIVAAILFILALGGLSGQESAKRAVWYGIIGMALAVFATLIGPGSGLWLLSVILIAGGHTAKGVFLILFCGLIVGSIDNFLRPRMVGKDTELPDLLILLATLGGIVMFGALGLIIGPIVAALFVTVWEIYGVVFKDVLPPGRPAAAAGPDPDGDEDGGTDPGE